MTYRYFAYGSSLEAAHFDEWAKEHGYARRLDDGRPAILDDHEVSLTVPSRHWMGAVGTIAPRSGASVYGVLFEVADEDADMIRHKEGVAAGLFQEVDVEVRLWAPTLDEESTIQLFAARAFQAVPGRQPAQGSPTGPSRKWLDLTVRGAGAWGLPDLWQAELKRLGR